MNEIKRENNNKIDIQSLIPNQTSSSELNRPRRGAPRGRRSKASHYTKNSHIVGNDEIDFDSLNLLWKGRDHLFDYPFNIDGYYYMEAEPNPQTYSFINWSDYVDKPLPVEAFRHTIHKKIELSVCDKAPSIKLSRDDQTVIGDKGYSSIRSNYGVYDGSWYFEIILVSKNELDACVRVGFSQIYASYNYPCGYDEFGYSVRSFKGTKFHKSIGHTYSSTFEIGDVIGCHIYIPENDIFNDKNSIFTNCINHPALIKFKSKFFFEYLFKNSEIIKNLANIPKSSISFYKNGVLQGKAFENIFSGIYFPTVSLYKSFKVKVNFGPQFYFPPQSYDPQYYPILP